MKKQVKRLLLIQFLILAVYLIFLLAGGKHTQKRLEIPLDQWYSNYAEYKEEQWQISADNGLSGSVTFLHGPVAEVEKGDYTATICYEAEEDQSCQPYVYKTNKGYVKSSPVILDKNANIISFDFQITEDIDNFELTFWYNGKGDFSVSGISIDRNQNDLKRSIVYLAALLLLINFVFYYRQCSEERRRYLLALIGIWFVSSIPVFYTGLDGHDLKFHLTRIEGIATELSYGHFPVRISSVWMAEHGYPVSVYYGDVLLYIPAVLRLFGFNIDQAYKAFVLLLNAGGVLIAEVCFGKIFQKRSTSLLLTLVYMTASYRLVDVYIRTAVGEYCALIFLPLIALAAYNIYAEKENDTWKKNLKNATILAFGMTGILTAHTLSAEMAAFALLLVVFAFLWKKRIFATVRTYGIAVLETLLFSAGFLVPFLDYYMNVPVEITDTVTGEAARTIQEKGANIGDFFAFFSDPFGDWYTALFNPGLVLMLALAAGIALWAMKKAGKEIKILTVLSGLMLFMATNVFPWNSLAHDLKPFDLLAQVQFPWRYVGFAIIFLTILLGMVLERTDIEKVLKVSKQMVIGVCAVISIGMTFVFTGYYADNLERNVYYDTANIGTWAVMGEEYLRSGTHIENLDGKIHMDGGTEYAELVTRKGCELDVSCKTGAEEGTVILPVLNYKGYQVTDEKGNEYEISDSEENLITVTLPAQFEGTIFLRFEEPVSWTASFAVSAVSLLGTAVFLSAGKIRQYIQKSKKQEKIRQDIL